MVFDGLHSGAEHDQLEHIKIGPASEFIVGVVALTALAITVYALMSVAKTEKEASNSSEKHQ